MRPGPLVIGFTPDRRRAEGNPIEIVSARTQDATVRQVYGDLAIREPVQFMWRRLRQKAIAIFEIENRRHALLLAAEACRNHAPIHDVAGILPLEVAGDEGLLREIPLHTFELVALTLRRRAEQLCRLQQQEFGIGRRRILRPELPPD